MADPGQGDPVRPAAPADRSLGSISIVLGLTAIPALLFYPISLLLGLAAVGTGAVALRQGGRQIDRGRAIAGIVLGVLAVTAAAVVIALPDN
jgi:hypothetical protein